MDTWALSSSGLGILHSGSDVGAFTFRIGFWGFLILIVPNVYRICRGLNRVFFGGVPYY